MNYGEFIVRSSSKIGGRKQVKIYAIGRKKVKQSLKNPIVSPGHCPGLAVASTATAKQKNGKQSQFLRKFFEIKRLWHNPASFPTTPDKKTKPILRQKTQFEKTKPMLNWVI